MTFKVKPNCIDVSSNQGNIDWKKVKAYGVDYAVLRSVCKDLDTDDCFCVNYKGAKAAGVKVGVYVYCYAGDAAYARKEAEALLKISKEKEYELGVWYDIEPYHQTWHEKKQATRWAIIDAFREVIEGAGYKFGIYTGVDHYAKYMRGYDHDVPIWMSCYGPSNDGTLDPIETVPNGPLFGHQYTSHGRVPGISGDVDCNLIWGWEDKKKRQAVVDYMLGLEGVKQGSAAQHELMRYWNKAAGTDWGDSTPWCAITAFNAWHRNGLMTPMSAGCGTLIRMLKEQGYGWVERDDYWPRIGDGIIYDWSDDGRGDCTGDNDHIGIIIKVTGEGFEVMEGNKGNPSHVGRRTVEHDGKYIRGFVDINRYVASLTPPVPEKYKGAFPVLPVRGRFVQGDTGTEVTKLQALLNWYGHYGLDLDGSFGPLTRKAVEDCTVKLKATNQKNKYYGTFGPVALRKIKVVKR